MRRPGKNRKPEEAASPDDTQEMFTQGAVPTGETEESGSDEPETREYRTVEAAETTEVEIEIEDTEVIEAIEDEEGFEEDEYEDWDEEELPEDDEPPEDDELPDEDRDPDEETAEEPEGKARGEDLKQWFGEFRTRALAIWKGGLKRIGDIRLPNHELDGQKVLVVGGIAVVVLLIGGAGYVLGKGSGEDVDSARLEGEFAGRKAGAVAGATKGYAAGFKKGRDAAFKKSYTASYRRNYRRAYENAGMEVPKARDIEVPEP